MTPHTPRSTRTYTPFPIPPLFRSAFGGRRVLILAKQADFVTDAGPTEMGDAQAGVDSVGKGEGVKKLAMRFRAQSDQRASVNVETAVPEQIFLDYRVAVSVVLSVIYVQCGNAACRSCVLMYG